MILLCGNYLNSGSIRSPAFGLLHYIVGTVEKEYHELLSFGEELSHVDRATRISLEKIHDNMQQITTSLKNLNLVLKNIEKPQSSEDMFREEMGDIAIRYNDQVRVLIEASDKIENHYKEVGEYYAFDPEQYPMEAFFLDIKTFKEMFARAHGEITQVREEENKRSSQHN